MWRRLGLESETTTEKAKTKDERRNNSKTKDGSDDITMTETKDLFCTMYEVTKFSGEDLTYTAEKWAQDLDDNAEIFGWSPQQRLIIARRSLTGTAELWLKTEKVHKTYEELKSAVLKEFPDVVNSKQMHELMAARKKRKDESCLQYMLIMKEMGKRAKFPDYVAIQYIVDGITDFEINKMMLYGAVTYPVLKEKLIVYENIKKKAVKENVERQVRRSAESGRESISGFPQHCFNCGDKDHKAKACRNGLKCFRCNEFGHVSTRCTNPSAAGHSTTAKMSVKQSEKESKKHSAMFGESAKSAAIESATSGCHVKDVKMEMNDVTQDVKNKAIKLVKLGEKIISALIDTGSDVNLISEDLWREIDVPCHTDNVVLSGLGFSKVPTQQLSYFRNQQTTLTFHRVASESVTSIGFLSEILLFWYISLLLPRDRLSPGKMGVKPAIGRKSNKNPPIFSHEFVIQNHADIVSCVVMVFLVGLMVQSTTPIASLFISLHHNVSGVEPTREAPKGEPFFYEAGWKDACAVFFYSLVCIVMHAILQEYFLDKISKKFHLSKSRLSALNESGQLVVFHLVTFVWGGDAIIREGFVFNISQLWDGYPNHPMSFLLKLWWIVQAAYWIHTVPELYFQRIKKDEWFSRIRHASAAFAFVALAYGFKFQRVGVCLVVLHSLAEFVAHCYRLNTIIRGEREDWLDKFLSLVNGSVFAGVRLCSLVLGVLTFYFGLAGAAPLMLRVAALSLLVSFQVYLMFNFISEAIKQRQESHQQALAKPKKEKKEKPRKEKVKKVPVEESDLPEVDQNTNKTLRQRQSAAKAK